MTQPVRQGDVILLPAIALPLTTAPLHHLTLAEGEVTGHRHQISDGNARLYQGDRAVYLQVFSETATLSHEEHQPIQIPQGTWLVQIQREYEPEGWRKIVD
jgi:hypothetical protein